MRIPQTFLAGGLILSSMLPSGWGHMYMSNPPSLKSKDNPYTETPDYSLTSPITGAQYPCKGYHTLRGTAEGTSVASWTSGASVSVTVVGGAIHGGGSCQVALSYDSGVTWTVLHSWLGNCPTGSGVAMPFRLPSDAPAASDALFAWAWWNRIGNREMYMNCAVVDIASGGGVGSGSEMVAFADRPTLFNANLGSGCETVEMSPVRIPNPGPDVTVDESQGTLLDPVGNCETTGSNGNNGPESVIPPNQEDDGFGRPGGDDDDDKTNPDTGDTDGNECIDHDHNHSNPSMTAEGNSDNGGSDNSVTAHPVEVAPGEVYTPGNDWPQGWGNSGVSNNVGGVGSLLLASLVVVLNLR